MCKEIVEDFNAFFNAESIIKKFKNSKPFESSKYKKNDQIWL